jgi:hypothetical protein
LWTKWTLLAIPGSFALTLLLLPTYASIAPHIGVSKEYYNLMPRMLSSSVFYFCLLLIPVGCLARDLAWKGSVSSSLSSTHPRVPRLSSFSSSSLFPFAVIRDCSDLKLITSSKRSRNLTYQITGLEWNNSKKSSLSLSSFSFYLSSPLQVSFTDNEQHRLVFLNL